MPLWNGKRASRHCGPTWPLAKRPWAHPMWTPSPSVTTSPTLSAPGNISTRPFLYSRATSRICERVFGRDHLVTLRRRSSWANCHYAAGHYPEAARLFREILQDRERVLGASHPDTQRSRGSLANARREAARSPAT